jgi:hypothetical protein
VGEATATYTTFSEDSVAAARFDNVPLDPNYQGFFRLPGTQTLLKIGGYFKTDFIYDSRPSRRRNQSLVLARWVQRPPWRYVARARRISGRTRKANGVASLG